MSGHNGRPRFDHPALLYRSAKEYVTGATAFVRTAVADGNPVLVAVPGTNLRLLRDALSGVKDRVSFADMAVAGRNPGRIIPSVLLRFAADHPGRRVSVIGEPIWPGRTEVEYPACATHEALINVAFTGRNAAILCPYDVERLDSSVIEDARHTHPTMIEGGRCYDSDPYTGPVVAAARFNQALPPAPAHAESLVYRDRSALAAVRCFVRRKAAGFLSEGGTEDLVLAANELATNTVKHTTGAGRITVWIESDLLVCQVYDAGHLTDPLAGRVLPPKHQQDGYGLVLTNELCDLVRVHSDRSGTTIRLHKHR